MLFYDIKCFSKLRSLADFSLSIRCLSLTYYQEFWQLFVLAFAIHFSLSLSLSLYYYYYFFFGLSISVSLVAFIHSSLFLFSFFPPTRNFLLMYILCPLNHVLSSDLLKQHLSVSGLMPVSLQLLHTVCHKFSGIERR